MEYNINPPKHSQKKTKQTQNLAIQKLEVPTIPKKERPQDHQIKEVRKQHHQKYIHSKIPMPEKNVIRTTSKTELDTTASSPSNPSSVTTPNTKLQIH